MMATAGCECGRSPSGRCIDWHKLSEAEFQKRLETYSKAKEQKNGV